MATTMKFPELLDERTAAAALDLKPQTLAVWRASGRYGLPFVKVGRSVRYRAVDLQKFLESRMVRPIGMAH